MDYGFEHAGRVYTPNGTTGIAPAENTDRNRAIADAELAYWATQPDRMLAYYHFPMDGRHAYTPVDRFSQRAAPLDACQYCGKLRAEHEETEPDRARPYRATFCPRITGAYVSLWPGDRIGAILQARVYRHNFGSRFVSLRVRGTNGAEYYGRASWDWGQCIVLRKVRGR